MVLYSVVVLPFWIIINWSVGRVCFLYVEHEPNHYLGTQLYHRFGDLVKGEFARLGGFRSLL